MSEPVQSCSAGRAVEGELDIIVQLIHEHVGVDVGSDLTGVETAAREILTALETPFCARCGSGDTCDAAQQPLQPRKTLDEFKEFLNDLADLNVEEPTQRALLAAREYIAEDNNPKSNRVLALIQAALDGETPQCSSAGNEDRLRCRQKLEAEYNDLIYLQDTGSDTIPLEKAMDIAELGLSFIDASSEPQPPSKSRPAAFLAWAVEMFGPVAKVRGERLMRFMEEATELAHADGMEYSVLAAIANRVYARDPGDIKKEIGQTQACLETYAENIGESSDQLAELEWRRVQTIPRAEWGRRHAEKQKIGIALDSLALSRPK